LALVSIEPSAIHERLRSRPTTGSGSRFDQAVRIWLQRVLDVLWRVLRADRVPDLSVEVLPGDPRRADDGRRPDLLDQQLPALPLIADSVYSMGHAGRRVVAGPVAIGRGRERGEMA